MVTYLYGFVPLDTPKPGPGEVGGIDDLPVELVGCGAFAAAVTRLPDSWASAEQIDARLADMDWVARHGLSHERVVAWFVDRGDIVPSAFLTIFSTLDALQRQAAERESEILDQLERVRGLREWDLKVGYAPERLSRHLGEVSTEVADLEREIEGAEPGRRFLLERKRRELVQALTADSARELAGRLLGNLRARSRDCRVLPLPRAGEGVPVVLSAALLLSRKDEEDIRRLVEDRRESLERVGMSVSFSGPWAPYRFIGPQDPEVAAASSPERLR